MTQGFWAESSSLSRVYYTEDDDDGECDETTTLQLLSSPRGMLKGCGMSAGIVTKITSRCCQ